MNFHKMIETHRQSGAEITIAAKPVLAAEASSLGIMRVDEQARVDGFVEKPQNESQLDDVRTHPNWLESQGVTSQGRDCLASMGIYVFNRDTLIDALESTPHQDFGKEVFPTSIGRRHVQLHLFDGYWEDIGTIGSFFDANLQLARDNPPFELATADAPIYTRPRFLPPTRVDGATIEQSLIADGCTIGRGSRIENSVVGLRCQIESDVTIRNSIIMGADEYESAHHGSADLDHNRPAIGIGAGSAIEGAIVDKNCRIGRGVRIVNRDSALADMPGKKWDICDGILVVEKGAILPDR